MELKGKKIAFLGDSITEGVGASSIEHLYWNLIAQQTGAACYGYGISGTRIAKQIAVSENTSFDRYFASRVEEMIPDADIIVIFGGTNDFGHGDAPFGTMADRTVDTFCGGYHELMTKLTERYPAADIIVMTPLHRLSEDDTGPNEFGIRREGPLVRYVDAIIQIAGYYGAPVVDLFRTCRIQPRVPIHQELYAPDGLHPNDAGHVLIANCLLRTLRSL